MVRLAEEILSETRKLSDGSKTRPFLSLIALGIVALLFLILGPSIVETNNSGWFTVKQAAVTGHMTAFTTPGTFVQGFGDVFKYKGADILYFSKHDSEGNAPLGGDDSIAVRFNDGATANVTGNVRVELPSDPEKMLAIHSKFRSYDALLKDTVRQVVAESVILTATLMSAEESYTNKRAEFSQMAYDQVVNGIYLTEADTLDVRDPKTGELLKKQVVRIQRGKDGLPLRKEAVFDDYGIRVSQFVIKEIDYEAGVDGQIAAKQSALQQTVSAKANAEKAVQDRLTAEEVGKKNVAVARYEQEVEKAKAITSAEKELEVAKLARSAAEQYKATQILKAEGDSEYRRKMMIADGALDKKLDAYVQTQKFWAEAFASSKNPVVPSVIMGGGSGGGNAAQTMMELMSLDAAKKLAINLSPAKKGQEQEQ